MLASIAKLRSNRIELLNALGDIVHRQREIEDTDRREARRLKIINKEIDKWVLEMEKTKDESINSK